MRHLGWIGQILLELLSGKAQKWRKIGSGGHLVFRIGPDIERNLGLYHIDAHAKFRIDRTNIF